MSSTPKGWTWLLLLAIAAATADASTHCEQTWDDIKAPHYVSETYSIHLLKINTTDEYQTFLPSTKYQVMVKSDEDRQFIRFYITVENENKTLPHGTLELYNDEISEFSQDCPESIVHVSQVLKEDISVYWTSPEEGGCVIFRASIMESPSVWFMDGSLEQKFCLDPKASIDDPGPTLAECCACEEAKYELAFEGLWSRYTHPKNFPTKPWSARFSDIVGASHTSKYRFWEYNEFASEGLQQVAEYGLTSILESELKNKSDHIRTIIKARGINFPNITSKTFAMFRVDQKHHLMSLVSMIDPSPDWFVGVTGLELCLSNCSWIEHKELNLYPIDAGTDDGITYEASDVETNPKDVIRRITTTWPKDERSPFYDETAIDMNPLAKLYLKRQRMYEKDCERNVEVDGSEGATSTYPPITRKACKVTPWGQWESCSVTCGRGVKLRQRKYKHEKNAHKHNCDSVLTDRVVCYPDNNFECPPDDVDEKKCPLIPWSDWTPCTKSCGPESRTRARNFRRKKKRKECKLQYPNVELEQTLDCENPGCGDGEGDSSEGTTDDSAEGTTDETASAADEETVSEATSESGATDEVTEDTAATEPSAEDLVGAEENRHEVTHVKRRRKKCINDRYTQWSFWTPCSVTCGTGTKSRNRQIKPDYNNSPSADKDLNLYDCQYESTTCEAETKSCEITKELMEVICSQPEQPGQCDDGHNDNSLRFYYDKLRGKCVVFHYTGCNGNMNNFRTLQECTATCGNFQDQTGLRNYKVKLSSIVTYNVPLVDDQRSFKIKRAKCDEEEEEESTTEHKRRRKKKPKGDTKSNSLHGDKVDCKVSEWSDWSPCYSCRGYRTMSRDILTSARNGGKPCPLKLMRRQKCHNVLRECDSPNDRETNQRNLQRSSYEDEDEEVTVNCRVSPWGFWSPCTATCGQSQRRRIRNVAVAPRGPRARPCPVLSQIVDCAMLAC